MGRVHDRQGSQAGLAMKRERVAKGKPAVPKLSRWQ